MDSLARVIPYLWPHRRKLLLSVVFALLVAVLWGLNLSATLPVVKVLLEGKTLAEYVDKEIDVAETKLTTRQKRVKHAEKRLRELRAAGKTGDDEYVEQLQYRDRQQEKLSNASSKLVRMKWIKAYVIPLLPGDRFDLLALILALVLFGTILRGLCTFAQDVLIGSAVELTVIALRKRCFRRVLTMDYQSVARNGTSDLMSRFTYDMTMLSNGLRLLGGKVVREPLKAIACIVFAMLVSWRLTLLSLVFIPLAGLFFYNIGRKLKRASHRMMESMSRIYQTLEETFDAIKIVLAFNGARCQRRRFHQENKEYYRKALQIVKIDSLTSPTTQVLGLFAAFLALLPGAYLVLRQTDSIWGIRLSADQMDAAELSLLYALLAGIIDPVRKLSSVYTKLKRSSAAADRIFGLLDRESLVREPEHPKLLPRHSRCIEFNNVDFSYAAGNDEAAPQGKVLDAIDLKVNAGEVVAVVGENGSGKSTLVNLLPRFFDPDRGSVLVDGLDIREVRLSDLRDQIGIVTQETLLFDQTIRENIRYGRQNAGPEEIERATRQAHVTQFVDQLPEGLETQVGEKGQRLSGGQRQRVALARAILRDPSILILDEATSAVDSQSEVLIHQALRRFVKGRTTFLITHSVGPSLLDLVTRIVVMQQGRLVAVGTHESLLETSPVYQKLFQDRPYEQSA